MSETITSKTNDNFFQAGSNIYAWKLALREMRGGLRGFVIFLICIALGVGAVAGVNSVSSAITGGLENEGRSILGGDLKFSLTHIQANEEQRTFLASAGQLSESANMRSIARVKFRQTQQEGATDQALIELRAVDDAWPLIGEAKAQNGTSRDNFTARNPDGSFHGVAAPLLFERLGLSVGDKISIGSVDITLIDRLSVEPDALSSGFGFAPRVLISKAALQNSGLVREGSLVTWSYSLALNDPSAASAFTKAAEDKFPQAGWRVQTPAQAAPRLSQAITRFSDFLTLVGLTVLVVGGVGVFNAVRSYLDGKRNIIATLKCLGAPASFITRLYLIQIGLLAGLGTLIGLIAGASMPFIAAWALEGVIPVASGGFIFPKVLLLASLFGMLVALVAALLPLGQAQAVPAAALFREASGNRSSSTPGKFIVVALLLAIVLAVTAILTSLNQFIATIFIAGLILVFVILGFISQIVTWLAKRAPAIRSTPLRLAIGNIHRPGALTPSIVLSLGLGLTLLVSLSLIENNLRRQLLNNIPDQAPSFFFVDIQNFERDAFIKTLIEEAPNATIADVPMLRGRIESLKGIQAEDYPTGNGGGWVLRGDRGITYASKIPENATLIEGTWWDEDYNGPPLISFAEEEARELGLAIGDEVEINVLGRTISAKIANFRKVEWQSLGINFVMVFSPNTFAGAPHAHLATLTFDEGIDGKDTDDKDIVARDGQILKTIANSFPAITAVRVKDAIDAVNTLIGQIALAIRSAAALTLIASILVLAGALSSGSKLRVRDSVILKTLGATRKTLITSFALEYGLLGLATAGFALGTGILAAWLVITKIMNFGFTVAPLLAFSTIVGALILTIALGLVTTWYILGIKVASVLRES